MMGDVTFLGNPGFFERTRLRVVSKIFPVKKPEMLLLDWLEISFKEPRINQIRVPSLISPDVTPNACLAKPELVDVGTELVLRPEIESFPLLSDLPRKAGKLYKRGEEEEREDILFGSEEDKKCIHGLKKSWCAVCNEKEKQERKRKTRYIDVFDLILPILQPPLGENFDSPIAFPPGMELYPFQRTGVKFLAENERVLLGDEMGLGKSIQAIVAIRLLFRMGKVTNGLILCPISVLTDWEKKLWEWAPELRVVKVRGLKEQRELYWNSPSHIYLTTYETLREDLGGSVRDDESRDIAKKQFDIVVLDEIQKIKNPGADVTTATRQIEASIRWGLSGTPLEGRLEELISIFAYLKPGLLHYKDVERPLKVKQAIKPYFRRRRISDVLPEFPKKEIGEPAWLELGPNQRTSYDRAEQEGIVALNEQGDTVTVQHLLALITKLKQICNIDPETKESCKLEYMLEKLEEVSEQGDKAIVFSQYPEKTLKFLEPALNKFSPLIYHGALSDSQRDQIVERFQKEEDNRVLLMSVKAGGLGLTLTRANYVYHFDLWWNPSTAAQAEGRVWRIGQTKTVFVESLLTEGTIEERIDDILKKKRELFKVVIDDLSDEKLSKFLTEEELFSLFGLQKGKPITTTRKPEIGAAEKPLEQISPQQFERLIGELYEKMGYHIKLTPQTKDQGVDIYAKRISESGTDHLAIQCKHYPNGVVGVEHVRSLYGVIQAQPDITKGILVTSGKFSKEAEEFKKRIGRIELFDGKVLCALLRKYNL
jgi:SNF2 family DNA or RNA helicase